jgi:long-chain acyl-CoA synthetase
MKFPNVYSLFVDRVEKFRSQGDVFYFRSNDRWQGMSWDEFDDRVHEFASALLACGLKRGESVCMLMGNVPEWPISDIGTIAAGGVGVGLYPTSSAEQCRYIIDHSDAAFVVVDTQAQLDKVLSVRAELPKVQFLIVLDEIAASAAPDVVSFRKFLELGRERREQFASVLAERGMNAAPDDVAIMVYTSGTTGRPKGACLSHRYIINSVESLRQTIPIF